MNICQRPSNIWNQMKIFEFESEFVEERKNILRGLYCQIYSTFSLAPILLTQKNIKVTTLKINVII